MMRTPQAPLSTNDKKAALVKVGDPESHGRLEDNRQLPHERGALATAGGSSSGGGRRPEVAGGHMEMPDEVGGGGLDHDPPQHSWYTYRPPLL